MREHYPDEIGRSIKQLRKAALTARMNGPRAALSEVFLGDHDRELSPVGHDKPDLAPLADGPEIVWLVEHLTPEHLAVYSRDSHPDRLGRIVADPWPAIVDEHL
jgi:hypothetical protein